MRRLSTLSPRAWKTAAMLGAAAGIALIPASQATAGSAAAPTIASVSPYMLTFTTPGSVASVAGDEFPQLPFNCPAIQDQMSAPGTSPSTVALPGLGFESVFQGANGDLWGSGTAGTADSGFPMAAGTSPSMAPTATGGYQFAWQEPDHSLWVTGTSGPVEVSATIAAGTSPSLTNLGDSSFFPVGGGAVAFQGGDGNLWFDTQGDPPTDTGLAMAPGTTPAIAAQPNGGTFQIVWQGANEDLWTTSAHGPTDLQIAMAAGTNPSLTEFPDGGYEIAVEGSNDHLWTSGTLTNGDTGKQMLADTSPSIAATIHATPGTLPTDDYYVAYASSANGFGQVVLDNSSTVLEQTNGADVLFGNIAAGTSPSLAILAL